jgi:hypothetical protein
LVGRILFIAFAAGFLGFGVFGLVYSIAEGAWAGLGTAAIFSAFGLGSWRVATARLVLEGDTFFIRSYFRTTRARVSEVDRFDIGSGAYGIDLWLLRSFRKITVNVIQKGNWALWPGERHGTKADVLVEKLNEVVRSRRGEHVDGGPSSAL